MAKLNVPRLIVPVYTHGGVPAALHLKPIEQLRRSVLSCMLWESQFYESGASIADRIKALVPQVPAKDVAALAIQARTEYNLRHVSLLLVRELARHPEKPGRLIGDIIVAVVQRADKLTELLAIYWST